MNEIAAYGGFPNRYPHWRFGMEYEQLSQELRVRPVEDLRDGDQQQPLVRLPARGQQLTDQKLVMATCTGTSTSSRTTSASARPRPHASTPIAPSRDEETTIPNRKWIDKMANHGARVARHHRSPRHRQGRGVHRHCLSLENLIDPWRPSSSRKAEPRGDDETRTSPPRSRAAREGLHGGLHQPEEYLEEQKKKLEAKKARRAEGSPSEPERDVLQFLLEHAPLERWERDVLEIIRDEAYYFAPQMQTKIMNEGWASYWHSRMMTEKVRSTRRDRRLRRRTTRASWRPRRAGSTRTSSASSSSATSRSAGTRASSARSGTSATTSTRSANWDLPARPRAQKIFEVRALYNDVTFIDEFLTPEFCIEHKLYTFGWSRPERPLRDREPRVQAGEGEAALSAHELRHEHQGMDLRTDYAKETLAALVRAWKRPVSIATVMENKSVLLRHDGSEYAVVPYKV
jgi:stage V sporulation protein R